MSTATRAEGALKGLVPAIRAYATEMRRKRAHEALWRDAASFQELLVLMQRFVRGELLNWPGHLGPRNDETIQIAEALAHVNGAGFLTYGSQPGEDSPMVNADGSPAECGATWQQRAAVEGHATDEVLGRLRKVCAVEHLHIKAHRVERRRRTDYGEAVTVSLMNRQEVTSFGAKLSRRDIEFMWGRDRGLPHGGDPRYVDGVDLRRPVRRGDPALGAAAHALIVDRYTLLRHG